jgi:hypothetical protein
VVFSTLCSCSFQKWGDSFVLKILFDQHGPHIDIQKAQGAETLDRIVSRCLKPNSADVGSDRIRQTLSKGKVLVGSLKKRLGDYIISLKVEPART